MKNYSKGELQAFAKDLFKRPTAQAAPKQPSKLALAANRLLTKFKAK